MSSEQAELHSSFYQTSAQFHSHFIFYCKYLTWHELAVIGFTNKNLNMDVCQKSDFFYTEYSWLRFTLLNRFMYFISRK